MDLLHLLDFEEGVKIPNTNFLCDEECDTFLADGRVREAPQKSEFTWLFDRIPHTLPSKKIIINRPTEIKKNVVFHNSHQRGNRVGGTTN